MTARICIDGIGAICGIALLLRARARVRSGVVIGVAGRAVIGLLGSLTAISIGVRPNFLPDVAAAILLITALALTRGQVERYAEPSDRLDLAPDADFRPLSSPGLFWTLLAVAFPLYWGIASALGSPPA